MANKLKDLEVTEVSLVDRPANPGAKVLLFKRAEPNEPPVTEASIKERLWNMVKGLFVGEPKGGIVPQSAIAKEDGAKDFDATLEARRAEERVDGMMSELWDMHWALRESIASIVRDDSLADKKAAVADSVAQFQQKVSDHLDNLATVNLAKKGKKISAERLQRLQAMRDELDKLIAEADNAGNGGVEKGSGTMEVKEVLKGLPDDQRKLVEAELAKVATLEQKVADLSKGQEEPKTDDVLKNADPEVRKRFEDLEKRLKEAEDLAKAEKEAREHAEMVKRAEAYSGIGPAEDVAKMLEQAYAISKEHGENLEKTLKAAQERIDKGALFAEVGTDGPAAGSAVAKIEARAAEIRKAEPSLTKEQAFAKALESDPELYAEYQQEAAQ
jgi:hypothetical protein